jgi:hypothetical protein
MKRMHRRMTSWATLLGLLAFALLPPSARGDAQVRIEAIDPPDGSTLPPQQSLNVRIAYTTDEAVSLWARPFLRGREVKQVYSNASARYTGSGTALGWFALTDAGEVDEIRVRAGGGEPYREWDAASLRVSLSWEAGARSRDADSPAWVGELRAQATERMSEQRREAASQPTTASDAVLFSGFMLTMLAVGIAGIVVPLWSCWKWQGGWRVAAAVPAAVVSFVILRILFDTARDPTSHNLWPFEVLMFSAAALVAIGALKVARRWVG